MSAAAAHPASALAGIALVVAAGACFATLDTLTKLVSATVPLLMALWFRYGLQAVVMTVVLVPQRGWALWHTRRPGLQVLRGLLLLGSSTMAFLSLKYLPVAEFTAIVSLAPLAITFWAAMVMREAVSPLRWLLVAAGFGGALMIIRPGHDQFSWAMLLPVAVLAINVAYQLLTSRMVRTEDPLTTHLYTGWVGALALSVAVPWAWQTIGPLQWLCLLVMGVAASSGHLMVILAYRRAPVTTLSPYLYAQIGFAVIGGWLAFAHTPDGWSLAGMSVIALCGALGAWLTVRENRSLRAALMQPLDS